MNVCSTLCASCCNAHFVSRPWHEHFPGGRFSAPLDGLAAAARARCAAGERLHQNGGRGGMRRAPPPPPMPSLASNTAAGGRAISFGSLRLTGGGREWAVDGCIVALRPVTPSAAKATLILLKKNGAGPHITFYTIYHRRCGVSNCSGAA